jgi:exonuclease I
MSAVFYDLETSDKNPIGQILNYSFIQSGSNWEPRKELSGLVQLSRLQLPDPGAILANRTDVREHQHIAEDTEMVAMTKIVTFLASCIEDAQGAIAFVGYNSSRFDLAFLRTSLVRNGHNPYFGGKLVPRDLLQVVQKAYLISPEFRELVLGQRVGEKKLSLSLETVGHALGLLSGEQAHESRADVVLTMRVAQWIREKCGLDVTSYEAYEGGKLHSTARSGAVYMQEQPEYDLSQESFSVKTPMALLDASGKAALWIDLQRYSEQQSPECIVWRSAAKHAFFVSQQAVTDPDLQRLARAALKQFSSITLKNFFDKTSCDIEMDIYRLDFDSLDLYSKAVRTNDKNVLRECRNPDAKVLWLRRQLANPQADINDPKMAEILRKYALHRYGGKMQLARSIDESEERQGAYHATLAEMMRDLIQKREAAAIVGNQEDQRLLDSLERYIRESDIVRVAGSELMPNGGGR